MNRWQGQTVLVAGLGVSGWSAIRFLAGRGASVRACDSRECPPYAEELKRLFPQIPLHCGAFDVALLEGVDQVVVSPGLDPQLSLFCAARSRGIPVIGDVEIFAREVSTPVVAVTGSNGKSTVVSLLLEMAQADGRRAVAGGNLGIPALDLLDEDVELIVLELSSFQLELIERLDCQAACVLNVSPDHLDRHADLDSYARAKARIYQFADCAVVNCDDPSSARGASACARRIDFSVIGPADFRLFNNEGRIHLGAESAWIAADELSLLGSHNQGNVLAAFALGRAIGLSSDAMVKAARSFRGLPHRCELVRERRGVRWINDSKGTNVGSTLAALKGLETPVILLAGGLAKGATFEAWQEPLRSKGRAALLFGKDASRIASDLKDCVPLRLLERLDEAVVVADSLALEGDSVLLSPGCASLDQFDNYMRRGEAFAACVEALP